MDAMLSFSACGGQLLETSGGAVRLHASLTESVPSSEGARIAFPIGSDFNAGKIKRESFSWGRVRTHLAPAKSPHRDRGFWTGTGRV